MFMEPPLMSSKLTNPFIADIYAKRPPIDEIFCHVLTIDGLGDILR